MVKINLHEKVAEFLKSFEEKRVSISVVSELGGDESLKIGIVDKYKELHERKIAKVELMDWSEEKSIFVVHLSRPIPITKEGKKVNEICFVTEEIEMIDESESIE